MNVSRDMIWQDLKVTFHGKQCNWAEYVAFIMTSYKWKAAVFLWDVLLSGLLNCLCRLQLYSDVHGHITTLDKEVCMTNVCYPSFRVSKHRTLMRDNAHLLCKPLFPDLWRCGEQPHANSYSFYIKSHLKTRKSGYCSVLAWHIRC